MLGIQRRFLNSSDVVVCWWNSLTWMQSLLFTLKGTNFMLPYPPVITLALCFDFFGFPKLN